MFRCCFSFARPSAAAYSVERDPDRQDKVPLAELISFSRLATRNASPCASPAHGPHSWNHRLVFCLIGHPRARLIFRCNRIQTSADAGLAVCYIDAMISKHLAMIAVLLSVALAPAARAAQTGNQAAPRIKLCNRPHRPRQLRRLRRRGLGSAGRFHHCHPRRDESSHADRLRRRRVRCPIASHHHRHSGACARAVAPAGSHRLAR